MYIESCSMFVRGGVYRVVKEAMGSTLAKFSVSALMFDYILTGPISGVSAGQYLTGFLNEFFARVHVHLILPINSTSAVFAVAVTVYFWWENIKGIPESSGKALRIMYVTTVMVVVMIAWCILTVWVRGAHLPPLPTRANLTFAPEALGWLRLSSLPHTVALIGILIAEKRYFAEVAKPLLFFAFSIPKSIFLPMFILVFGVGFAQKVGFGFFSTIFIVIMSTTTAVESVKPENLLVARSYGATPAQTIWRVYVPSMLPVLLEALRISMIFNLTGVMLAEMYASREGLGHLIANWGENFMMRQLLAGVLMVAIIAIAFNELVRWVETRCSHWRT